VWTQAAGVGVFVAVTFVALRVDHSAPRATAAPTRRRVSPFVIHLAATATPWVDVAYCAGRGLLAARPGPHTELVIEGFPRSANTYARAAFLDANPGVVIASHLHSARSVRRAVRLDLPVIVLVRDPMDAVASLMVRDRRVHPWSALKAYERFYRTVVRFRDRVVVARFSDVTDDLASVIDRVNIVAGTQFVPYRPDGVTEARVHAEIDRMERVFAGGAFDENAVSRPSGQRFEMSHEVRAQLGRPKYQDLIAECRRLHDRVLAPSLSRQSR